MNSCSIRTVIISLLKNLPTLCCFKLYFSHLNMQSGNYFWLMWSRDLTIFFKQETMSQYQILLLFYNENMKSCKNRNRMEFCKYCLWSRGMCSGSYQVKRYKNFSHFLRTKTLINLVFSFIKFLEIKIVVHYSYKY